MRLVPATDQHLDKLMGWFPDAPSLHRWGGPEFRFPFTRATFLEDTRPELPSFSLVDEDDRLLGFGQFYRRADRCHLARLAVAPDLRGRRLGVSLIQGLAELGCERLGVDECALFVMADNAPAVRLYTRLGFVEAPYPQEGFDLPGCVYMVAPRQSIAGCRGVVE